MNKKAYLIISGSIFGFVALGHLCRLVSHWPIQIGTWEAPLWVSWPALAVAAALSLWAICLTCCRCRQEKPAATDE